MYNRRTVPTDVAKTVARVYLYIGGIIGFLCGLIIGGVYL